MIAAVRSGNRPVADLTSGDFRLQDDGVAQIVDVATMESIPIDVDLLLDTSGSVSVELQNRLRLSLGQLVATLRPDDRVRLIAVNHALRTIPTANGQQWPSVPFPNPSGGTSLYDGLTIAMLNVGVPDRRHLVMAFTDGQDTTSITSPRALIGNSQFTESVVYAVVATSDSGPGATGWFGPSGGDVFSAAQTLSRPATSSSTVRMVDPDAALRIVTLNTGGQFLVAQRGESLSAVFAQIIKDFRTCYVLRYSPSGVKAGGWHSLTVKVLRPGRFDVRARRGYMHHRMAHLALEPRG